MECIKKQVNALLQDTSGHIWLAYSGGLDSQVLLHVCRYFANQLTAVHINHQLQPQANDWQQFCQTQAVVFGVNFIAQTVQINVANSSLEAAARNARYRALAGFIKLGDVLLTAHHQSDQAETVLLQLLRGAGLAGLAAMPVKKPFAQGYLLRPLLTTPKSELLAYAEQHGLKWIDDPSNQDLNFDRNFLRHEIIPKLQQQWPGLDKTLARSAQLAGEAKELLQALAEQDLAQLTEHEKINIQALMQLSKIRQANALRYWLQSLPLSLPSQAQLEQVLQQISTVNCCVRWPGAELRSFRGYLYAMLPQVEFDRNQILVWQQLALPLQLPDGSQLQWQQSIGSGVAPDYLHQLTVRFRQGGERFHPAGRRHSQSLKKLLQEAALPPWQRERLPLIYSGEQLIWVAGLGASTQCLTARDEQGFSLHWQPS